MSSAIDTLIRADVLSVIAGNRSTPDGLSQTSAYKGRAGFEEVMRREAMGIGQFRPEQMPSGLSTVIVERLDEFSAAWQKTTRSSERLLAHVGGDIRPLFELQMLVNKLALETNILSRAGDTIASTIRQVQQLGGR